ncbi:hypothetical protein PAXINDRAFT_18710 [Paxillus involutus ATCC 200175]|uniref:Uncharacterized protein n=1 Tax=Paxillus involutus ATCC 200175 TaxID=664439 RepID=A0A0C9SYD6_PAXIN|nr:hypothetical protein PAXINDRAFT_18710 [Paxillus involutus ATCC 200175]
MCFRPLPINGHGALWLCAYRTVTRCGPQASAIRENPFVRLTPNTTAWCEALAVFLQECGYGLTTQDNLRRQFSNTYHWYIVLVMHNKELVSGIINASSSRQERETSDGEEEEGGAHEDAKDPRRLQYPSD